MKVEEYEKIQELYLQRASLIGELSELNNWKEQKTKLFMDAIAEGFATNKLSTECALERFAIKYKDEIFSCIQNLIEVEILELSHKCDVYDKQIESINVSFGVGNGEEESHNED